MELYKPAEPHDTEALTLLTNRITFELLGYMHQAGLMSLEHVEQLILESVEEVSAAGPDHAAAVDFFGRAMINNIPRGVGPDHKRVSD